MRSHDAVLGREGGPTLAFKTLRYWISRSRWKQSGVADGTAGQHPAIETAAVEVKEAPAPAPLSVSPVE